MDSTDIARRVIAIYPAILIGVGVVFNSFTCFICLRKDLRKIPTFIFLAFISIADIVSLLFYNVNDFVRGWFNQLLENTNEFHCRSLVFLQCFGFYISAWLLTIMSIERYLSINGYQFWKKVNFNSVKAVVLSFVVVLIAFGATFYTNFATTYEWRVRNVSNVSTSYQVCIYTRMYYTAASIQTYAYSLVPFFLIGIVNILLIKTIVGKGKMVNRTDKEKAKRRAISISIISITLLFILLTAPRAIVVGYFLLDLQKTKLLRLIFSVISSISFSYHASIFFNLFISNKLFRNEVMSLRNKEEKYKSSGNYNTVITNIRAKNKH